jgi:glycerol kinase
LWDQNGNAVTPAIVWACKRSISICGAMHDQAEMVQSKTGLPLDPYFSATKLLWCLQEDPALQQRVNNGEIYFGTVDTWLLYHLTEGKSFATDYTNACRTMLFNIHSLTWDESLLQTWNLNGLHLPKVQYSASSFGSTDLLGVLGKEVPVSAIMGDSHAALFGEVCFNVGDTKMTMGTGSSLLMNIGKKPKSSQNGLVTTIGFSTNNEIVYAWEGAIVSCGSMMEWLKDSMHLIDDVKQSDQIAFGINEDVPLYLIPAFSGLGTPFWKMSAKASIHGMDFGTTPAHLIRATLESICFQVKAVIDAMEKDLGNPIGQIAMHGGLSKNTFVQSVVSNIINASLCIQQNADISSAGVAFMAGLQKGIFESLDQIKQVVQSERIEKRKLQFDYQAKYIYWKKLIDDLK